jgi:hypothetical protein
MSFINETEQELQLTEEEEEERRRLSEYIRQEEQNKIVFFSDLKIFKKEYENLKYENEELKRQIKMSKQSKRYELLPSASNPVSHEKYPTNSYQVSGYGESE